MIKSVIVFNVYTSAVLHNCHGIGNIGIYTILHSVIQLVNTIIFTKKKRWS